MVKKHSFWEVQDGRTAKFARDSWKQESVLTIKEESPILNSFIQNHPLSMVAEFEDPRDNDWIFRSWKDNNWCKSKALEENAEDFIAELNSRKITKNDSPNKLRWG